MAFILSLELWIKFIFSSYIFRDTTMCVSYLIRGSLMIWVLVPKLYCLCQSIANYLWRQISIQRLVALKSSEIFSAKFPRRQLNLFLIRQQSPRSLLIMLKEILLLMFLKVIMMDGPTIWAQMIGRTTFIIAIFFALKNAIMLCLIASKVYRGCLSPINRIILSWNIVFSGIHNSLMERIVGS